MNFFPDERAAELRELFFESAQELLQELNEAGLELENHPGDAEVIRRVRRVVHTLKGDSAACGYKELSGLAHEMEDALGPEAAGALSGKLVELIFTAADTFQAMLTAYRNGLAPGDGNALREHIRQIAHHEPSTDAAARPLQEFTPRFDWSAEQFAAIREALSQGEQVFQIAASLDSTSGMRSAGFHLIFNVLRNAGTILALHPADAASAENAAGIEAVISTELSAEELRLRARIPSVVDQVVLQTFSEVQERAQDLLDIVLQAEAHASGATAATPAPHQSKLAGETHSAGSAMDESRHEARAAATLHAAENSLRVEAGRIDTVLNLIGELIIGKSMLHRTIIEFDKHHAKDPLRGKFADALAFQSRVLDDLQRSVMKIRMVPVEQLFRRFPRVLRDTAKLCGRDVAMEVAGESTDLDKGILDALAEPIAHLVRNAISHGIESPKEREAAGKPKCGTVRLNAYHEGSQVVLEVSDDGRGIDRAKLIQRAMESGAISVQAAEKISEADAVQLIFHPGLSTADEVTEVSGRGVGMDVVAQALERLKGTVEVLTSAGKGTTFRLMVPLTLASIQGLLFEAGGRLYAVPLANVVEIVRAEGSEIHRIDDYEVIRLREQLLSLVRLGEGVTANTGRAGKKIFIVVIRSGERRFGLVVDSLMGEEELVVKALDDRLSASDLVSGASILGDGTVILILNVGAVASRCARHAALGAIA